MITMIKGKAKDMLTAESIFEKIDDYNIFRYYLGSDFKLKKFYKSPFRATTDKTPNLRFFMGSRNRILFKDFANGYGGDCITFVMKLFNLSYPEALQRIDRDFSLGIGPKYKSSNTTKIELVQKPEFTEEEKKPNLIQIIPARFTQRELDYWGSYSITPSDLDRKNIYNIKKLYINKQLIPNYNKEMRFAYKFDNYLKIYSPYSKEFKWISSTPNDYISGFDDIKYKIFKGIQDEKLVITKSLKDEIILGKFFKDVCSTQNESSGAINEENMKYILKGYKPENVYMAYDNDKAGVENSTYYTKNYNFSYINVPKVFIREDIKDWSDLSQKKGLDTVENYLKIKKLIN